MTIPARLPFYVSGFPKSGTTWLTWLLGDLFNSPTGGSTPAEDATELATEGTHRPGKYIVRKGHYVLTDEGTCAVPEPHHLNPAYLGRSPVVFIVRDPRDVALSAAHYFHRPLDEVLTHMETGGGSFRALGPYNAYLESWLYFLESHGGALVKYEALQNDPAWALFDLCRQLSLVPVHAYDAVIARQCFNVRKARFFANPTASPLGVSQTKTFFHRGQTGAWHTYLTPAQKARAFASFGPVMRRLDYLRETR